MMGYLNRAEAWRSTFRPPRIWRTALRRGSSVHITYGFLESILEWISTHAHPFKTPKDNNWTKVCLLSFDVSVPNDRQCRAMDFWIYPPHGYVNLNIYILQNGSNLRKSAPILTIFLPLSISKFEDFQEKSIFYTDTLYLANYAVSIVARVGHRRLIGQRASDNCSVKRVWRAFALDS